MGETQSIKKGHVLKESYCPFPSDKATSELLPPGSDETLLTSLQLSDLIRSKAVDANHALRSLRRRIAHKNPNVQIQSLHVLDVLVKNSGEAFLLTVGNGKDGWMAQLEELCTSVGRDLRVLDAFPRSADLCFTYSLTMTSSKPQLGSFRTGHWLSSLRIRQHRYRVVTSSTSTIVFATACSFRQRTRL